MLTPLVLLQVGNEGLASEDDADTEEALKEFDFLVTAEDGEGAGEARSSGDGTEWGETTSQSHTDVYSAGTLVCFFRFVTLTSVCLYVAEPLPFPPGGGKSFLLGGSDDVLENVLGLGDLADLTVANDETDYSYDVRCTQTDKLCSLICVDHVVPTPSCCPIRSLHSGRRGTQSTRCGATSTACEHWPSTLSSRVWSPYQRTTPSNCGTSQRLSLPKSTHTHIRSYSHTLPYCLSGGVKQG